MAITRIFQTTFNIGGLENTEMLPIFSDEGFGSSASGISDGYYPVWNTISDGFAAYRSDSTHTQAQMSFILKNMEDWTDLMGVAFMSSTIAKNLVLHLYYDSSSGYWYAYAGATQLGSFKYWIDMKHIHVGIDFKLDASSGWCYVYINGSSQLSYSGQTNQAGYSSFDVFGLGPINNTYDNAINMSAEFFVVNDTNGEGAAAAPILVELASSYITSQGNYSQWHGTDGDQTSNYLLLDYLSSVQSMMSDGAIESLTSGHRDSWGVDGPRRVTDASTIPAVVPLVVAKTRSVTDGLQVRVFTRVSGSDGDGSALTPDPALGVLSERLTTTPAAGSWTFDDINGMEIGIKFE